MENKDSPDWHAYEKVTVKRTRRLFQSLVALLKYRNSGTFTAANNADIHRIGHGDC